jgi:hypothetical protein
MEHAAGVVLLCSIWFVSFTSSSSSSSSFVAVHVAVAVAAAGLLCLSLVDMRKT